MVKKLKIKDPTIIIGKIVIVNRFGEWNYFLNKKNRSNDDIFLTSDASFPFNELYPENKKFMQLIVTKD